MSSSTKPAARQKLDFKDPPKIRSKKRKIEEPDKNPEASAKESAPSSKESPWKGSSSPQEAGILELFNEECGTPKLNDDNQVGEKEDSEEPNEAGNNPKSKTVVVSQDEDVQPVPAGNENVGNKEKEKVGSNDDKNDEETDKKDEQEKVDEEDKKRDKDD